MAIETTLGSDGLLFIGEDKRLRFKLGTPRNWDEDIDGVYSVPNMSTEAWVVNFVVRKRDGSPGDAIIDEPIDGFEGVHNASATLNKQFGYIDLTDDQLNLFKVLAEPYRYSFKRMDADVETILAYGDFGPERATAR